MTRLFPWLLQKLRQRHNLRAHFWQSLANYTQSGGGMLLGIALARLLEPAVFGQFVFITATLAFLMIPVSFSTAQLLISDAGKTPGLLGRVLGLAAVVCVVKLALLVAYIAFSLWQGDTLSAIVATIAGTPLVIADYITALRCDLEGRGMFKQNFVVQMLDLAAHAFVSLTLVSLGYGVYGLALGALAGFIPHLLLYPWLAGRTSVHAVLNLKELAHQLRTGLQLWLGSVPSNWYSRVDKIILGHFGGTTQLGYYNRAMNYGPVSHILLNSFMTNAAIRGLATRHSVHEQRSLFLKTMGILIVAGVMNGIFWYFGAESLVPLIFGEQWRGAIPVFSILGWLAVCYCLLHGSTTILYACRAFKAIAFVHLASLSVLVALLLVLARGGVLTSVTAATSFVVITFLGGCLMMAFAARILFPKTSAPGAGCIDR